MIEARLPDAVLQFPDGTADDIIDKAVAEYVASSGGDKAAPDDTAMMVPGQVDAAPMTWDMRRPAEPALDEGRYGAGVGASDARIVSATGSGLAEGWAHGASGETTEGLRRIGVLPPPGQDGTLIQKGNEIVWTPLAAGGDLLLRGGNALIGGFQHGAQQIGNEIGMPGLGRTVAGLPEAFPTGEFFGTIGIHPPAPPRNTLAPRVEAGVDRPYLTPKAQAQIEQSRPNLLSAQANESSPSGVPRFATDAPVSQAGPAPPPMAMVPLKVGDTEVEIPAKAEPQPAEAQSGGPQPAGAMSSTPAEAAMTPAQEAAYRSTAEGSKLIEPQLAGERDNTAYVRGVEPNTAEIEQTVHAARDLKMLNQKVPDVAQEAKVTADRNSEHRTTHLDETSGGPVDLQIEKDKRAAQAEADLQAAWVNKKAADASSVRGVADSIMASKDGRRPLVRRNVDSVMDEMKDKDGNLLTDPEQLHGVRMHIDDLLEENDAAGKKKNIRAEAALMKIKNELDKVIEAAAPGFGQFLKNFNEASRRIDEMGVLQEHRSGLFDSANRMQYSRFQRMMKNIVDARMAPGINPYKSIRPETMARLWALRDDLRRSASAQDLARAAGSDSFQNTWHAMRDAATQRGPAMAGAAIGGLLGGGPISAGMGAVAGQGLTQVLSNRAMRADRARGMQMLHPTTPLRNPLGPP